MPGTLTELLAAAVEEISSLHQRLDALQRQVDELQSELRHRVPDPADTRAAQSPPAAASHLSPHPRVPVISLANDNDVSVTLSAELPDFETETRTPLPELRFNESTAPTSSLEDGHTSESVEAQRRPFIKWLPTTDAELPLIEARCRLKAEASRWAYQRRQLTSAQAEFRTEIEPRDRQLITQAKQLPDCFLWMSHPSAPVPSNPQDWMMLAGSYEVLATATGALRRILEDEEESRDSFEKGVNLLAEAQSALRIAVTRLGGPPTDHDQARIFGWLKSVALDRQIFIRRFMRLDDPGSPETWENLQERVTEFESAWENTRGKKSLRKKLLGRIRYKLSHLSGADSAEASHHWTAIAQDVEALIADGLPPSNLELREMLLPFVESFPELASMPKGFQLTVREIDRYLASMAAAESNSEAALEGVVSDQVSRIASLMAGKTAIIIGGDRRPHAAAALEKAFQLAELIWIDTRAHESVSSFEPYVARPEVCLVLLAIRWSSHSYGEVQDFCRQHNKPLVRLPGGYNPNQVASQILDQGSDRLL